MIPGFGLSLDKYKNQPFIITNNKSYTYSEIDKQSDVVADFLKKLVGVKKGTLCLLYTDDVVNSISLTIGIWKCGAVVIPIDPAMTEKEKKIVLQVIKPDVILKSKELSNFPITGTGKKSQGKNALTKDPEDTALVILTSGTSGKPKGVKLSYSNLAASFEGINTVLPHSKKDKWLASLPYYHIGGFSIITRCILSGASVIIPDNLQTETLIADIKKHKPTLLSLVSTQFNRILELNTRPNNELRKILLGGGFIDDEVIQQGLKKKWSLAKVYGSSETATLVTYLDCNKEIKLSSAGKPLPGNKIQIMNKKKLLPTSQTGEICIQGPSVAFEYINNRRDTNSKFKDGWYHSGDFGYLDEEGYLFIEARRTDLIVSGGKNISPNEVESALRKIKGIKDAAVFAEEDKEWGHIVSAAVILNDHKIKILPDTIKQQLKKSLSSYKIPKKIYFVESFPLTPLGKIKRQELIQNIKNPS